MGCVFCGIAASEIPSRKLYEDEHIIAFHDIAPVAPVHVLVIPRAHIPSLAALTEEHSALMAHIFAQIPHIARSLGVDGGFRLVSNCGESAGQTVEHLHFHIIGGKTLGALA